MGISGQASITRRRFLVGGGHLAGVAAVAACGEASPATPAPSNAPLTLTLHTTSDYVGQSARGQVTERGLAEYKRRFPLVTVNVESVTGNLDTVLTTLMASDSIGDVALWSHRLIVYAAKRDQLTDLRPYLKTHKFSMDDVYFIPGVCYYENKLIGVPFQLNLFDWHYNKSLFKQMGVAPPADNWTWDQFIATAKRLTIPGKDVWGTDWTITTGRPDNWITPIRANGGTLLNATFTKTTLDEPAAVEAIGLILDVVHKHLVAPLQKEHDDKKLSFNRGSYAMRFGQYSQTLIKEMADQGMEWDFFYAPIMPRSLKRAVLANMAPYCVPASKRTKVEPAAQLTFFLGGEFVQGLCADLGAAAPTSKKIIDSDRYLPPTHRRKIVLDGHAYRPGYGSNFEQYVPWRAAVEPEFFKGWAGEQSARATAGSATAAGDGALAANGVVVRK